MKISAITPMKDKFRYYKNRFKIEDGDCSTAIMYKFINTMQKDRMTPMYMTRYIDTDGLEKYEIGNWIIARINLDESHYKEYRAKHIFDAFITFEDKTMDEIMDLLQLIEDQSAVDVFRIKTKLMQ